MRTAATQASANDSNLQTRVCSEFENRLREGEEPRIEDFAGGTQDCLLISRLLMIELRYRYLRGEKPGLEEYASRFPELSGLVKRIGSFSKQLNRDIDLAQQTARASEAEITQFDQYDLLAESKSTTEGVVWRGWDRDRKRPVAIRVVPAETVEKQAEVVALYECAAEISHPHILQLFEVRPRERDVLIVTEHVDGVGLRTTVRQGVFEANQAARFCSQLAEAIDYLHERGLAFQRVSSRDVYIDVRGRAKLMHLASLRRIQKDARTENSSGTLRDPQYPNRPQPRAARDPLVNSNLLGLGVLLYEMLTGCVAHGRLESEVAAGRRISKLKPPRSLRREIPVDVEAICLKALRPPQENGYHLGRALAEDLRRFCIRLPVSARRMSFLGRMWYQIIVATH